ncbi:hypothetical protein BJ165DRAFT_1512758 [Panaeolus papilionaceus]|nr:hypothetical protein BJ165DRAFT_1512758 [Panaeolus papilionaceus]
MLPSVMLRNCSSVGNEAIGISASHSYQHLSLYTLSSSVFLSSLLLWAPFYFIVLLCPGLYSTLAAFILSPILCFIGIHSDRYSHHSASPFRVICNPVLFCFYEISYDMQITLD